MSPALNRSMALQIPPLKFAGNNLWQNYHIHIYTWVVQVKFKSHDSGSTAIEGFQPLKGQNATLDTPRQWQNLYQARGSSLYDITWEKRFIVRLNYHFISHRSKNDSVFTRSVWAVQLQTYHCMLLSTMPSVIQDENKESAKKHQYLHHMFFIFNPKLAIQSFE